MKIKVFLKKIIPANIRKKLRKLQRVLIFVSQLLLFYSVKPLALITKKFSKKKIYIFTERGIDAGDNGYYMYKYFKDKGHKCFYIIDKNCDDAKKIEAKDIISPKLTLKHCFLYQKAYALIYTHYPYSLVLVKKFNYFKCKIKLVFLQHGVTQNKIKYNQQDLFITSSIFEKDFVIKQIGINEEAVTLTGLARFDDLFNNSKKEKILLIMPTWRRWLHACKTKREFLETEYCSKWNSLLNNKELLKHCEDKGFKIIFYPHYNVRKLFGNSIYKLNEEQKDWNVHKLLLNCSLVVTDYSSIAFDVAYQLKPVIYYQFDRKQFFDGHYQPGYYDYKNGLGHYSETEKECVEYIINALNNGLDNNLKQRITNFFYKIDNHNCERIYNAILKIK